MEQIGTNTITETYNQVQELPLQAQAILQLEKCKIRNLRIKKVQNKDGSGHFPDLFLPSHLLAEEVFYEIDSMTFVRVLNVYTEITQAQGD
ncbi:hypothetical protein H5410_025630 [Solanum commersonii]|uniref:Uncharacterized protein n=1 Tax=Solanum commersonii TaxID=4109 RepID=A0A9J5YUS2_SOLCO|nr:hypothetical protein H5410_025630 [Solanum commersonii]